MLTVLATPVSKPNPKAVRTDMEGGGAKLATVGAASDEARADNETQAHPRGGSRTSECG